MNIVFGCSRAPPGRRGRSPGARGVGAAGWSWARVSPGTGRGGEGRGGEGREGRREGGRGRAGVGARGGRPVCCLRSGGGGGGGGREGRREASERACHVASLTLGASCRTSPRKSTGKWQTGLTGFTRSSLDRAAHYHNRLQRRRRGAPVAAAGPAGTLARRAPAAATSTRTRTSPDRAGPRTRGVCTGGRAGAEPGAGQQQLERRGRRRLPADPAVRAGLGAGGGRRPGAERPGRVGGRRPVPSGVCDRGSALPRPPPARRSPSGRAPAGAGPGRPEEGVEGWKKGRSQRASARGGGAGFSPRGWRAPRSLYPGGSGRRPHAHRADSRGRWGPRLR